MSRPAYRFSIDRDRTSSRLRRLPWWALLAGAAIACTDDLTTVDSTDGSSLNPTNISNVVNPDHLTVAVGGTPTRVRLAPSDSLFAGPIGGTASLVGTAYDASGARVPGVTLKFWEDNPSFDVVGGWYHTTGSDGSVTVQVKALAVGAKRLILSHHYGAATRDSIGVRVMDTAPPTAPLPVPGLAPAAATLDTGETQQFTAVVDTMNDGSAKTFAGTWNATGGAVTSGGLYKAGAKAGSYRVIATEGGKADTAAVTINPPPTDPPPTDPPPPPSSTARGCPTSGYLRLVSVSTNTQLASALSGALPGDQIRLAAGTYASGRSFSRSGTAANPIVLCGVIGAAPILTGGQWNHTASYVTLTGLVFSGAPTESVNLVYVHEVNNVVFTGNEIRNGRYNAGLSVDGVHHMTISYNYIHDNGSNDPSHHHGVYFKTTTGPGNVIANNVISHNVARGLTLHDNTNVGVHDVLVTHNTIVNNGSNGFLINNGDRNIVANNVIAFNGDVNVQKQIRIVVGANNQIRNNLTYSTTASLAGIENEAGSVTSGNVIGNPLFVSQYRDLHLQAESPAVDLALTSYVWGVDYDGQAPDATPDAGAYQR